MFKLNINNKKMIGNALTLVGGVITLAAGLVGKSAQNEEMNVRNQQRLDALDQKYNERMNERFMALEGYMEMKQQAMLTSSDNEEQIS